MRRFLKSALFLGAFWAVCPADRALAASSATETVTTYWELISSGGLCMLFLGALSVALVAIVIYHFQNVRVEKMIPADFCDNLLFLVEKKEFDKATSICRQQKNLISDIVLKGLQKISKDKGLAQDTIQTEGRVQLERIWQNLIYIENIAAIAPMLGLLGTIFGMIDAFHYFKATSLHPSVLTQGLAKAMINTAFGLVITVPALGFYAFFRGRVSLSPARAAAIATEVAQASRK